MINKKLFEMDENICTHLGEDSKKYFGAVTPPIVQTTLFSYPSLEEFIPALSRERENYVYTRGVNPTVEVLEKKLAALECGEKCKCFASGMAAISSTLFTLLKAGNHILFLNNIYGPVLSYCNFIKKYGVEHDVLFSSDIDEIEKHIKPNTRLIYLESPSTTKMEILDLEKIAILAKRKGIITAIDNTWSTPLFQKPLTFGIDISIHSCTKYIGGHSDVVGGAVIGSHKLVDEIFEYGHQFNGGALSPFDAWLAIRGLRTLPIRMKQHQESAIKVIDFLKKHPKIEKINHPYVLEGEAKELAEKQMRGYSSLFSIELVTKDFEDIKIFVNSLSVFQIGVSWGGFESLVNASNNGMNKASLESQNISPSTVRLYIGLENAELLIEDINNALSKN